MLLLEDNLSREIKKLLSGDNTLRIAVAFIGNGASRLINPMARDVRIVCNLTMGGTNPVEVARLIEQFGKENIRQIDNLHAKLYISSEYAIVGSANMSNNGLGTQPNALREAGYKFNLDQPSGKRSLDWFHNLWESAHPITDQDLKETAEKWSRRNRARDGEDVIESPPPEILEQQPLSEFLKNTPLSADCIFSFYYHSRPRLNEEDEAKIQGGYGNEIEYFEEGTYDNKKDADRQCNQIRNRLELSPNGKIVFCINMVATRNPRGNKFRADSFVAKIKDILVFKSSAGKFEVISLHEECKNYPITIDEKFTELLSSAYIDTVKHPNFYNFVNEALGVQNNYCTFSELKNALN
ncbi:hypothetical protein GCM10027395_25720 [Giesbergeria sinuosa]